MRVNLDSTTDHYHNVPPFAKVDVQRLPRFDGWYSTTSTRQRAVCVGKVHGILAHQQKVYLVTLTHGRWTNDRRSPMQPRVEFNGYRRRKALRLFLDLLRKQPGYAGHLWTTERHKSGALHHHIVVRFSSAWSWRPHVQRWSWRYCGSCNGLDVQDVNKGDGNKVNAYVAKVLSYCSKGIGKEPDYLPFRWWGTSKVVRTVDVPHDLVPDFIATDHVRGRMVKAKVPDEYALHLHARHTAQVEHRTAKRRMLHHTCKRLSSDFRREQKINRLLWETKLHNSRQPAIVWPP